MFDCCHDPDVCDCSCHDSAGAIIHCFPCCEPCPYCRKNIVYHAYDKHVEACAKHAHTPDHTNTKPAA